MVHLVLFPVGGNCEPWVIATYFMSPSGYLSRSLLNKDRFQLWAFPEDIWMHMNEEQFGYMCRHLSSSAPSKTLQVILETVLKSKSENGLGQDSTQSLLESIRKQKGDDLWNPDTAKMARTIDEMKTDNTKGDYSRVLIKM